MTIIFFLIRALTIIFGISFIWALGLVIFSQTIAVKPDDMITPTDGVVVFTGTYTRVKTGLSIFKAGFAKHLFISGVNLGTTLEDIMPHQLSLPSTKHITLGYKAKDTVGNAQETASWVKKFHLESIRLITSNYHLQRSLLELKREVPDIKIIPHPVIGENFKKEKWWLNSKTIQTIVAEYNKYLYALIREPIEKIINKETAIHQ